MGGWIGRQERRDGSRLVFTAALSSHVTFWDRLRSPKATAYVLYLQTAVLYLPAGPNNMCATPPPTHPQVKNDAMAATYAAAESELQRLRGEHAGLESHQAALQKMLFTKDVALGVLGGPLPAAPSRGVGDTTMVQVKAEQQEQQEEEQQQQQQAAGVAVGGVAARRRAPLFCPLRKHRQRRLRLRLCFCWRVGDHGRRRRRRRRRAAAPAVPAALG